MWKLLPTFFFSVNTFSLNLHEKMNLRALYCIGKIKDKFKLNWKKRKMSMMSCNRKYNAIVKLFSLSYILKKGRKKKESIDSLKFFSKLQFPLLNLTETWLLKWSCFFFFLSCTSFLDFFYSVFYFFHVNPLFVIFRKYVRDKLLFLYKRHSKLFKSYQISL